MAATVAWFAGCARGSNINHGITFVLASILYTDNDNDNHNHIWRYRPFIRRSKNVLFNLSDCLWLDIRPKNWRRWSFSKQHSHSVKFEDPAMAFKKFFLQKLLSKVFRVWGSRYGLQKFFFQKFFGAARSFGWVWGSRYGSHGGSSTWKCCRNHLNTEDHRYNQNITKTNVNSPNFSSSLLHFTSEFQRKKMKIRGRLIYWQHSQKHKRMPPLKIT